MEYISVNYNFKQNKFVIKDIPEHSVEGYKLGVPYPEHPYNKLTGYVVYCEKVAINVAKDAILKAILHTYHDAVQLIDNVRKQMNQI